jgi:outer membrane protein assembly factor BamB
MRGKVRSFTMLVALALIFLTVAFAPAAQASSTPEAAARWPQFQGNAAHTGLNRVEATLNTGNVSGLTLSWVGEVPGTVDGSSPMVADGSVYISSAGEGLAGGAGLYVFPQGGCGAPTCDPSWHGATGPNDMSAPAVVGGLAYVTSQASFTSNNGRLNVFDAHGCGADVCQPLWQGQGGTESFLVSSPAVIGGVVYVGSVDGRLYAFDAAGCGKKRCAPLWTADVGGDLIDSSPAVAGGVVYVASFDGRLAAFDAGGCGAATCGPLWTADLGGTVDVASPAVAGGRVFIGNGSFLNVFDAAGCGVAVCEPLWRGAATFTGNTPAVSGNTVYIDAQPTRKGRANSALEAFDVRGCGQAVCKPLWTGVNFNAGGESSPVVANGVVYLGKGPASPTLIDSGVFSYDAAGCGAKVCKPLGFAQAGPFQLYFGATPAIVDGQVYFESTDRSGGGDAAGVFVFALS